MVRFRTFLLVLSCLVVIIYFFATKKKTNLIEDEPDLLIYSYSSFSASWGPGPKLKKKFEDQCHCHVEIRDAEDSRLLIRRVQLEGEKSGADLLIGLNQWDVSDAIESLKFQKLEIEPPEGMVNDRSKLYKSHNLMPFDWGIFTFNVRKNESLSGIRNLEDFLNQLPPNSLVLQNPVTSAPGSSFLFWLCQIKGIEGAFAYLKKLSSKVFTITAGWSSSYGLFQKGQASAVFSYTTSPLFHQIEEKNENYLALPLEEGLPVHIELAGVLDTCKHCNLAHDFIKFLLTKDSQEILMKKNYMLPVDMSVAKGTPWESASHFTIKEDFSFSKDEKLKIMELWSQWLREK